MTTATLPLPSALPPVRLQIEGMTCASCVARVEKALRKVPGVGSAEVNLATETRRGRAARPPAPTSAALAAAVAKAGYQAHVLQQAESPAAARRDRCCTAPGR